MSDFLYSFSMRQTLKYEVAQQREQDKQNDERNGDYCHGYVYLRHGLTVLFLFAVQLMVDAVYQSRNSFVHKHGDGDGNYTAQQIERQDGRPNIKVVKCFLGAVCEKRRHHADERVPVAVKEHSYVKRNKHEAVEQNRYRDLRQRSYRHGDERALERAVFGIDQPCGDRERTARNKIGQLADEHRRRALDNELYQNMHYRYYRARARSERERADQNGRVGQLEFEEAGERERQCKVKYVQNARERGEHSYKRYARGTEIP